MDGIACMLFGMYCAAVVPECTGLRVDDPWVREAPPKAEVMAAYMTLVNDSEAPIVLTGVASPSFRSAEFHRMSFEGEQMRMERLDELTVPAGGQFALEPGGPHIMLFTPDQRQRAGDKLSIRLQCGPGKIFVDAPVRKAGFSSGEIHE